MIASLSGTVREIDTDAVVIENQGVGFFVYVPKPLCDRLKVGEQIFLYTQLLVREDALTLVGFETSEARRLFNLLVSVGGVGYRLALAILSNLSGELIRSAIIQDQSEILARVPGVGKKTAQKIILTLQDKIRGETDWEQLASFSDVDGDVLSALTALGYSIVEAQAAIQSIPKDTAQDLETRLRIALSYFSKSGS